MALVTRFFSTVAAGTGTGLDWDNRAALFNVSGQWSPVLAGFDFTSDAMEARIGPGTYTCNQTLANTVFTNAGGVAPNAGNGAALWLVGCDSNGEALAPPDPTWQAAQPPWDASALPLITSALNLGFVSAGTTNNVHLRCLNVAFTARGGGFLVSGSGQTADWCAMTNSASATTVAVVSGYACSNSVLSTVGSTSFNNIVAGSTARLYNCRVIGPGSSATGGTRQGVVCTSFTNIHVVHSVVVGCEGGGIISTSTQTSQYFHVVNCVITRNGVGLLMADTAAQIYIHLLSRSVVTSNSGYGVEALLSWVVVAGSRFRDNTSGAVNGMAHFPLGSYDNITSAGSDDDEFVDAANGDYRIKYGSPLWGRGIGAGDGPIDPGVVAEAVWTHADRELTA
jgi:hypothetical protein